MSSIKNKNFIIFDFDGTLTDEAGWYLSKWKEASLYAVKKYGFINFFAKIEKTIKKYGFFFKTTVNEVLKHYYYEDSPKIIADIVNYYKRVDVDIKVLTGARPILSRLKSSKKKLGIISNGNLQIQMKKIKNSGLVPYFDKIIITGKYQKPDTLPYRRMAEFFRAPFLDMVYIADNPYVDFIGAKKLNIFTVRINQGIFKNVDAGPEYEADAIVYELKDILNGRNI